MTNGRYCTAPHRTVQYVMGDTVKFFSMMVQMSMVGCVKYKFWYVDRTSQRECVSINVVEMEVVVRSEFAGSGCASGFELDEVGEEVVCGRVDIVSSCSCRDVAVDVVDLGGPTSRLDV